MPQSPPLAEPEGAALAFLGKMANATGRRTFLQFAGLTIGVAALGCSNDQQAGGPASVDLKKGVDNPNKKVDLGSGDVGILNYAYALEQLEAAFYITVLQSPYSGMSASEAQILTDVRDHEITHRDFFKAALGANAISALTVDFSSITFSSRSEVLGAARVFEDLGVSAYNGAGQLLESAAYLLLAGKIVSVEARHAAVIRDLISPNTEYFAGDDVVDANGLDGVNTPDTVLAAAGTYLTTRLRFNQLPTIRGS